MNMIRFDLRLLIRTGFTSVKRSALRRITNSEKRCQQKRCNCEQTLCTRTSKTFERFLEECASVCFCNRSISCVRLFELNPFSALCCNNTYSRRGLDSEQLDQYCKQSKIHLSYCIPQSNKRYGERRRLFPLKSPC